MLPESVRIGVTMRVLSVEGYDEPRDALAQNWGRFLKVVFPGAPWIPLPNLGADAIRGYAEHWGFNRLLLTGGEDLGACPIRDETERELLTLARERDLPVLGICRGMQIMASYLGARLKPVEGHVRRRHVLQGTFVHEVNSFHKYGLATCPEGFAVTGRAEDGEIESIAGVELRWEGWMWHPERETPFNSVDVTRLRGLFS